MLVYWYNGDGETAALVEAELTVVSIRAGGIAGSGAFSELADDEVANSGFGVAAGEASGEPCWLFLALRARGTPCELLGPLATPRRTDLPFGPDGERKCDDPETAGEGAEEEDAEPLRRCDWAA